MKEGGATSHRGVGIFSQAGEVGRQNGRRYLNQKKTSLASDSAVILPWGTIRPHRENRGKSRISAGIGRPPAP